MSFNDEITRLTNILKRDYLQRDPTSLSLMGSQLILQTLSYDLEALKREAADMKSRGLNIIRMWMDDWYDRYLKAVSPYLTTLQIVNLAFPMPWSHHVDPFDHVSVEEWNHGLDLHLKPYADDNRVYGFDLLNEPLVKPENYGKLAEVISYAKTLTDKPITIGLDAPEMFKAENNPEVWINPIDIISFHTFGFSLLHGDVAPPKMPWELLDEWLTIQKGFNKPILISELGFPTYMRYPSNQGNTPYVIPDINENTIETERLQYYWMANMLHVIKKHKILGFITWQWVDNRPEGEGGFGLKTQYPQLNSKLAMELISKGKEENGKYFFLDLTIDFLKHFRSDLAYFIKRLEELK